MPVYVYRCDACGLTFEQRQHITEPPLTECPECDGHVQRVIQPVGVVFKGSGFYVTDNRSPSSTALPGKKETDTEQKKDGDASSTSPASTTPSSTSSSSSDKSSGHSGTRSLDKSD
jgi:putative FmdB family regulatory protein